MSTMLLVLKYIPRTHKTMRYSSCPQEGPFEQQGLKRQGSCVRARGQAGLVAEDQKRKRQGLCNDLDEKEAEKSPSAINHCSDLLRHSLAFWSYRELTMRCGLERP